MVNRNRNRHKVNRSLKFFRKYDNECGGSSTTGRVWVKREKKKKKIIISRMGNVACANLLTMQIKFIHIWHFRLMISNPIEFCLFACLPICLVFSRCEMYHVLILSHGACFGNNWVIAITVKNSPFYFIVFICFSFFFFFVERKWKIPSLIEALFFSISLSLPFVNIFSRFSTWLRRRMAIHLRCKTLPASNV